MKPVASQSPLAFTLLEGLATEKVLTLARSASQPTSKMDAFNKLVGQCDELLRTADVLGRDQSLVLVKKLLSEFQNIHFPTPDQ